MGFITKIRESSSIAISVIAAALFIFLIGQNLLPMRDAYYRRRYQTIGEIAGEPINVRDYQQRLDRARRNFASQYGYAPGPEIEQFWLSMQVWQEFVKEHAFKEAYKLADIQVIDEELIDIVQGENIHASVKQYFTNPETGKFEKEKLIKYLKSLSDHQRSGWADFEKYLRTARMAEKFQHCMEQSAFITDLEAKKSQVLENTQLQVNCLHIPFQTIKEGTIEVSDDQLQQYLMDHKEDYQVSETKSIHYIVADASPSAEDIKTFNEELEDLTEEFKEATNAESFAKINTDGNAAMTHFHITKAQMPPALKDVSKLYKGLVVGPVKEGGLYRLYKVTEVKGGHPATYGIAVIEKKLTAGDETRDLAFRKADRFAGEATKLNNLEQFEQLANAKGLTIKEASYITKEAFRIQELTQVRGLVRWLYGGAKIGNVSKVFDLGNRYIVAMLTGEEKEGLASVDAVRTQVTYQVKNELKAQQILAKLKVDGNLQNAANNYGKEAKVFDNLTLELKQPRNPVLGNMTDLACQALTMQPGQLSQPIVGDTGVVVFEVVKNSPHDTSEAAFKKFKEDLEVSEKRKQVSYALMSMDSLAGIKDYRYKFF